MNAEEKQEFLVRNKSAFEELDKIIQNGLNLKNISPEIYKDYELECRARRYAVEILENWIGTLFTDAYSYEHKYTEEESVYKFHESNIREDDRDNQ